MPIGRSRCVITAWAADAGRAQERRADRGGDGAGPGRGPAPVAAAFRRQRAVVGRAGSGQVHELILPTIERTRADRSLDHRRHRVSEEGPAFGRGGAAVLRPARQAGQLPGRGQPVARQPRGQPADRLAPVSAAGMDGRCRAPRRGRRARGDRVSRPSRRSRWSRSGRPRGRRSAARGRADGCRLWQRHPAAHGDRRARAELCRRHPAAVPRCGRRGGAAAAAALVGPRPSPDS